MPEKAKAIPADQTERPWWKLDGKALLLVAGAGIFSVSLCLWPPLLDRLWIGACYMTDFRLWPRWYFTEIIVVLLLSLYWFRFYVRKLRGHRDGECLLRSTLLLAAAMFVLAFVHRLSSSPFI